MLLLRYGLAILLVTSTTACEVGAPERASAIQNVDAVSDDIAAVRMTRSPSQAPNPNASSGSTSVYSPYNEFSTGLRLP